MVGACRGWRRRTTSVGRAAALRGAGRDAAGDPRGGRRARRWPGWCTPPRAAATGCTSAPTTTPPRSASPPEQQAMDHPVADHAKQVMMLAAAGTGVPVCDGSTNVLPVGSTDAGARRLGAALPAGTPLARAGALPGLGPAPGPAAHPLPGHVPVLPVRARRGRRPAAGLPRSGGGPGTVLDEPATAKALAGFLRRGVHCGAVTRRRGPRARGCLAGRPRRPRPATGRLSAVTHADLAITGTALVDGWLAPGRGRRGGRPRALDRGRGHGGRRPRAGHARRRRGAAARPGRHPRARQRAGSHRVGGLRLGDPRRGGRGRDHPGRHAAELDPADDRSGRAGRQAPRGAGQVPRRRRASGAARCPSRSATWRALHDGRRLRVQVLPGRQRRAGVPAADLARARPGAGRGGRARRAAGRARRGRRRARRAHRGAPGRRTPGSSGRGRTRPRTWPSPGCSTWPRPHDARVHVLHLSSADALPRIAAARAAGVAVSVETCPHYLTLSAEEIPDGRTEFKCCPPIRGAANQDALWQALADGLIDCVVSDHSPATPDLKCLDSGDFGAGVGRGRLAAARPAAGVDRRPRPRDRAGAGRGLDVGRARRARRARPTRAGSPPARDADLVVFAPDEPFEVDPARLHHRHPLTPYAGRQLVRRGTRRVAARAAHRRGGRWWRATPPDGC